MNQIRIVPLAKMSHGDAWRIQEDLRAQILAGDTQNHLMMVEHPPTISLGSAEKGQNLDNEIDWYEKQGFDVTRVNRGGMVTYHGPGQLVVYPIINLQKFKLGIKDYVCKLEQTMIDTLEHFDIHAQRMKSNPGVYVDGKKIGSVGIHVRKFVSIHGLALNVNTNLEHFSTFTPCGINQIQMTSIQNLGASTPLSEVSEVLQKTFAKIFDCQISI